MKPRTFTEIDCAREDLDVAEQRLLRSRGWVYANDTPDSTWMFQKKVGNITYSVSQSQAVDIEQALNPDDEDYENDD